MRAVIAIPRVFFVRPRILHRRYCTNSALDPERWDWWNRLDRYMQTFERPIANAGMDCPVVGGSSRVTEKRNASYP
jgi:hypothetical protein